MKIKDKAWLSFNNIRQDKNSILSIVMLAIAFTMLIPIMWTSISFYYGYESKLKTNGFNNIMTIDYSKEGIYSKSLTNSVTNPFALYDRNTALKLINESESAVAERIDSYMITLKSGLNNVRVNNVLKTNNGRVTLKFYDDNSIIFPSTVDTDVIQQSGSSVLKEGEGFGENGRGKIIVSEKWLSDCGFNANESLNKKISLAVEVKPTLYENSPFNIYNSTLDNDDIADNPHELAKTASGIKEEFEGGTIKIFESFTIVGIINNEYYNERYNTHNDAHIWLTKSSLYADDCTNYLPRINYQKLYDGSTPYNGAVITYQSRDIVALSNTAVNTGLIFPFFIDGGYESIWTAAVRPNDRNCLSAEPIITSALQFKNYNALKRAYAYCKKAFGVKLKFTASGGNLLSFPVTPDALNSLTASGGIEKYSIVLSVVGSTIFIATLFNYYNHLSFLSRRRVSFYGVMLTLGAKHKECKLINLMEVLILFGIAICISAVPSLLICVFVSRQYMLSLAFFPSVLGIIIALSLALSVSFSFVTGYSRRKRSPASLMRR